jgi:LPS sulfotransferase NodH
MPPNPVSAERFHQNETAFFQQQVEDLWKRWQSQPDGHGIRPRRYLILSTPRTGSTMLSRRLNATDQLGYVHEWLNWEFMMHTIRRFGHGELPIAEYIKIIDRATTSPTGIFGVNIHVHQVRFLLSKGFDVFSLGFERIYWLERADRTAQAYSWAKAFKSKCWSREMELALGFTNGLQIEITPLETARFLTGICEDTAYYRDHIASRRAIDREFCYEDLASDRCRLAVNTIMTDFGLPPDPIKADCLKPAALEQSHVQRQDHDRLQLSEIKHFFGMEPRQTPIQPEMC